MGEGEMVVDRVVWNRLCRLWVSHLFLLLLSHR